MKNKNYLIVLFFVYSFLNAYPVHGQIAITVTNSGNTTPILAATYTSLANALVALNATTAMSGPVILTCASGGSETCPPKGLTIGSATLNPVLSAVNKVTINTSGGTVTLNAGVGTATPASTSPDGILNLSGADFITLDGLTLSDGNTTNPETMEYGIGLFKRTLGDGASNNTIKNCIINMQRVNNAASTAPMMEGSVGILVINSTLTAATTSLTPTTSAGSNSNNKIYSNIINGGNTGIALSGYSFASTGANGDAGNDIGGTSAATGNTIINFGGGGITSLSVGVRIKNQWNVNVSYNSINNNDGSGINHGLTLKGIYAEGGTNASCTIGNNNITIKGGGTTSQINAIDNSMGSTGVSNTVNIINNTIQNCSYTTATTGQFHVIQNNVNPNTLNITGNIISNNSLAGSSQSVIIHGSNETNLNISSNVISSFNRTGGSSGTERAIDILNAITSVIDGNLIEGITWSNSTVSSNNTYGIYTLGTAGNVTITNNIIRNHSTPTTGFIVGIKENGASGTKLIRNNEIYNFFTTAGGLGVSTFEGIEVNAGNCDISNNKIYSLNVGGPPGSSGAGGGVYGIYVKGGTTNTITKNRICDLSNVTADGIVIGINFTGGTTNTVSNCRIGDLRNTFSGFPLNLKGISVNGGTNAFGYFNTVYLNATSSASGFGSVALEANSTVDLTLKNNILINTSTANGTGKTIAFKRSNSTLSTYNSNSNKNDFFAPFIFSDGTNILSAFGPGAGTYKNFVSTRDANSISEIPPFLSSTCGDPNFLKINTSVMTDVESGGANISGITTDFESDIRQGNAGYAGTGIAPDIGADEFNGIYFPKCSGTPAATSINGVNAVCSNTGITLSLNTIYTETGYTYQWKYGANAGGPYPNNLDVLSTQSTGNLVANTYYICTIQCSNSGLSFTTPEKAILINALPAITVSPSPALYCTPGPAVSLAASGASTYIWSPASGLSATVGSSVNASPTASTTYTITGTDVNGCTATTLTTVIVTAQPQFVNAYANPSSICVNSSTTLSGIGYFPNTVNNYSFSSGTGTLNSMVGATTVISSPAVNAGTGDDSPIGPLPIGFNFIFNGASYSQFSISPDGWVFLGSGAATAQFSNSVTSTTNIPKIYPLWDDICTGSNGNVKMLMTGNSPNRILIIQWLVTIPRSLSGSANSTFQLWMYENSNIEFHYGACGIPPSSSAGLTGSATNFNSITFSSNTSSIATANNANNIAPVNGRVYSYNLPPAILTYDWVPVSSVISPNTQTTQTTSLSGTMQFTVTATNAGCSATSAVTVIVEPLSCLPASVSAVTCSGSNFNVTANYSGGVAPFHYVWTDGVGGPYGDLQTITSNLPAGNYTFSCTVSDVCGLSCTSSIAVIVNPLPTVIINPSSAIICNPGGSSVSLTASGANTYSWSPASGLSGTTSANVSALPSSTTTYSVIGTSVFGCTGTATTVLSVNTKPTVSSTVSPSSTVCEGTSVTLSGTGAVSYTWTNGVVNGIPFTPTTTTTYTVTGTASNSCSSISTRVVTVNAKPTVGFTSNPSQTVCAGSSVTLAGTGATSYSWTGGISNGISFIPVSTTTYTVTGTASNSCTNTASAAITVNALPTVSISASPSLNICSGGAVTLSGTGANSYSWSGGITNGLPFSPVATTIYTVVGTDINGCTKSANATITVENSVALTALSSLQTTCIGSPARLSTLVSPQASYCQPTTNCSSNFISNVSLSGINRGSSCDGTSTNGFSLYIYPNPELSTGSSYPLSVITGGGFEGAAAWIDWNQDGTFAAGEQIFSSYAGTNPATYLSNVLVPLSAVNGSTRMRIRCIAGNNPSTLASPSCTNVSLGETEDYYITVTGGISNGISYQWQPTTFLSNSNIFNPSISSLGLTTTYTVTSTTQLGCTSSSTVIVIANNSDDANICTDDFCDPATGIVSHSPSNVNDNNVCTSDYCLTASGIHHDALANGSPGLSDGLVCTNDICTDGLTVHNSLPFEDNNPCTNDGCTEPSGVFHTPVIIDDGNACTLDVCNSTNGIISHNNICFVNLSLRLYIEGYYSGSGVMENASSLPFGGCLYHTGLSTNPLDADIVNVSLMTASFPHTLVDSKVGFLKTSGDVLVTFGSAVNIGSSYYIKVTQRNCVETWSALPVTMNLISTYYFNTAINQAYGNNMIDLGDGNWAFYSGDISDATLGLSSQDGIVESQDYGDMENAVSITRLGYVTEDLTGDGIVESSDYVFMENNVYYTRISIHP